MGRLRGCLWLTAGLVVAVLAGGVAFITLQRAAVPVTTGQMASVPGVPVVVSIGPVPVRALLTAEDLEVREVPVNAAPQGAIRELDDAIGKITLVDLYAGEVILQQRLVDPDIITADGRLALVVAEDEVLMAFPAQDLMSTIGVLKPGDQVDLLFSLQFPAGRGLELPLEEEPAEGEAAAAGGSTQSNKEEQFTFNLLQNVTIASVVYQESATGGATGNARALLFTVSPQDALLLKYARDAGGIVDIVLRSPGTERPFATQPVDMDYMIRRFRIPTEVGR
ncbi:MAG TPA: Flp pilus assembly protein CpaB [Anaerolineae bacterium]|nr:Flp pilus assembly protein CpaB [Anaerolineae bacterium]